jgi:hypothetical protein
MENEEKQKEVIQDQLAPLIKAFLQFQEAKTRSDEKREKQLFELERRRIEAERQTEKWNKVVGGVLTLLGLGIYAVMTWYGKMTEGLGIFTTAIVTASLSGIFKNLLGKKKQEERPETDEES